WRLPPGVRPPTGRDVIVDLGSAGAAEDVTVNFDPVESGGTPSVELIDPQGAGELPLGYQTAGSELAFEIWTTATYIPPITVCFVLSGLDPATFAAARFLHTDGGGLVDVTSLKDPGPQTICGVVT